MAAREESPETSAIAAGNKAIWQNAQSVESDNQSPSELRAVGEVKMHKLEK